MMDQHKEAPQTISETTERQALGERLRQARDYIGLSQEEVARLLKLPRTAITGMESGQRRVEATELKRLSAIYRQPISYLSGETDIEKALPADVAHMARTASELSIDDRKELGRFAEYLRARGTLKGSI
jgi:transcriptional regulator with XRE-family HTH domain